MNRLVMMLLAFVGGAFLALQGGLNAQLGEQLKNPLLASVVAFSVSAIVSLITVVMLFRPSFSSIEISGVPNYLWVSGGFLSAIGIGLYYYTIPKLGISTMISLGLCGQLICSIVVAHFGWFNLPVEPLTLKRILGALAMIIGILLINIK